MTLPAVATPERGLPGVPIQVPPHDAFAILALTKLANLFTRLEKVWNVSRQWLTWPLTRGTSRLSTIEPCSYVFIERSTPSEMGDPVSPLTSPSSSSLDSGRGQVAFALFGRPGTNTQSNLSLRGRFALGVGEIPSRPSAQSKVGQKSAQRTFRINGPPFSFIGFRCHHDILFWGRGDGLECSFIPLLHGGAENTRSRHIGNVREVDDVLGTRSGHVWNVCEIHDVPGRRSLVIGVVSPYKAIFRR